MKNEVINQSAQNTLERKPIPKEPQRRRFTARVSCIKWVRGQQRIFGMIYDENGVIFAAEGSVNYAANLRHLEIKPGYKVTFDAIAHFERIKYLCKWIMKGNITVIPDLWMSRPCNVQIEGIPIEEARFALRQQPNQSSSD